MGPAGTRGRGRTAAPSSHARDLGAPLTMVALSCGRPGGVGDACACKPRSGVSMQSQLSQFERHQLDVIARVTPHAMAGHLLNTTVLAVAVAGAIPTTQLIIWCIYSYAIALA